MVEELRQGLLQGAVTLGGKAPEEMWHLAGLSGFSLGLGAGEARVGKDFGSLTSVDIFERDHTLSPTCTDSTVALYPS